MRGRLFAILAGAALALAACGGTATQQSPAQSVTKLSAPLPADIQSKGKLQIGIKCDYPPFGFVDETNANAGFEIDLSRQLATYAFGNGSAVEFQCVTSGNRIPFLTTKRIDLIVATITFTNERAKTIKFSKPYFSAAGRMIVLKGSSVKEAQDLAGKPVSNSRGAIYVKWLKKCLPTANVLEFDQTSQALSAVEQGRAEAFMQDDTLLANLALKAPDKLKMVGKGVAASPWGMGIRLEDSAFASWVDAAVDQLQKDDWFFKTFQKWVKDPDTQKQFQNSMPRPGKNLQYPANDDDVLAC